MAAICHAVAGAADKEHTGLADLGLHHLCSASGSACSHQTPAAQPSTLSRCLQTEAEQHIQSHRMMRFKAAAASFIPIV